MRQSAVVWRRVLLPRDFTGKDSVGNIGVKEMIKAIVLGTSAYVRDCRHDKEYKQKKWLWRIFRVRDDSFDYRTWKRGNWWAYVRIAYGAPEKLRGQH